MTQDSGLPHDLVEVLLAASGLEGEQRAILRKQAHSAVVTSESPTIIDLVAPRGVPRLSAGDGPLPGRAIVYREQQPVGEVIVWMKSGFITGLEQAWFTPTAPSRWPSASDLRLES